METAVKISPLEAVQQIYANFGKGDVPAIIDQMAEKVQWEQWADNRAQKAGVPYLKAQQGKAGVMEFFQVLGKTLKITEFNVLDLMQSGHQVAAEVVLKAEVIATGKLVLEEEMHLWTLNEEGKVTRFRHYLDTAKHIEATR